MMEKLRAKAFPLRGRWQPEGLTDEVSYLTKQMLPNILANTLKILIDIGIGIPKNSQTLGLQKNIPGFIPLHSIFLKMLRAI